MEKVIDTTSPARDLTVGELLWVAQGKILERQKKGLQRPSDSMQGVNGAQIQAIRNRHFALAITAIEDARMRTSLGLAIDHELVPMPMLDLEDAQELNIAKKVKRDLEEMESPN